MRSSAAATSIKLSVIFVLLSQFKEAYWKMCYALARGLKHFVGRFLSRFAGCAGTLKLTCFYNP